MRLSKLLKPAAIFVLVLGLSIFLSANFWFTLILQHAIAAEIGLPVTITGLDFRPWQGVIKFQQLLLQNPPGFGSPYLLAVHGLDVQLLPASLSRASVELEYFSVTGLEIYLEQGLSFNLLPVINHLSQDSEQVPIGQPEQKETKIKAKLVEVQGVKLHTILPFWQRSLDLARLELKDVQTDQGDGVPINQVFRQILFKLFQPVIQKNLLDLPKTALVYLGQAIAKLEK
ncbi:MAG: hypothetical protein SFT94_10105 [Pseudanabaenaceae cyanobacterium bins.68]|nr:hypothetical protein [Pseudanabaenaceae cyanobacterium bins.68]